jgi:hypothetical protein
MRNRRTPLHDTLRRRQPLLELAGLEAFDYDSNHYLAHAVLLLPGNMLNVSHAAIGRVVAVPYAGPGLAVSYGRRMLFARELPPPTLSK